MQLGRSRLNVLFNALYDLGVDSIPVEHPSNDIGELVRVELGDDGRATVRFTQGAYTYEANRDAVPVEHGEAAYDDLPDAATYTRAVVASGLVDIENKGEITSFFDRYGYADLEAGHGPAVLGLDTNIVAWRLPEILGVDSETGTPDDQGRAPTNGYALATGVKEELDWHYKQYNTHELSAAFGSEFERLNDQPAGSNREGFMGLYEYRRLRTNRTVDIVDSGTGDAEIVDAYSRFNEESRKTVLLLSNDYGFVDRATEAGVPAQHITFPVDIPRKATGTWTDAAELLYYLAVLFGVLKLPKVTLYGVWNGKDGRHWQHEEIDIECRSPKVEPKLERDLRILAATDRR